MSRTQQGAQAEAHLKLSQSAFNQAQIYADQLRSTSPEKIKLAYFYSNFLVGRLEDTKKGYDVAKTAYDDVMSNLECLHGDDEKRGKPFIQLLGEDIEEWGSQN